jgi:hypothetical protein
MRDGSASLRLRNFVATPSSPAASSGDRQFLRGLPAARSVLTEFPAETPYIDTFQCGREPAGSYRMA